MKKYLFYFFFLITNSISFSQSKKEQIEQLNNQVDSLKQILSTERTINIEKVNSLNLSILNLQSQIIALNTNLDCLNKELHLSTKYISNKTKELEQKQEEINTLIANLKTKTDSLNLFKLQLSNVSSQNNFGLNNSGEFENLTDIKSVLIGTQSWMTENLNVSTFRNGDIITEAKTNAEWENSGKNKQPAWCYYDNDPKYGEKYGKLYNWYAVNDPRGLAPAGWHVPGDAEWQILENNLGAEGAGKKMKSTSGWDDDGNGTNSSGFSGLPGGFRHSEGDFYNMGNEGCWFSRSLGYKGNPDALYIWNNYDDVARDSQFGDLGNSVRCLKD
jgi:uncharacterized protein (TIGR02145 family)